MKKIKKHELIALLAEKMETSKLRAEKYLNALVEVITKEVVEGNEVSIVGFGSFSVKERSARQGINPQTLEPMSLAASKNIRFKTGKILKRAIK